MLNIKELSSLDAVDSLICIVVTLLDRGVEIDTSNYESLVGLSLVYPDLVEAGAMLLRGLFSILNV